MEQRFFIKPTEISQSTDNQSCQQIGYAQTGGAVRNKMAKEFKKVDAYHMEEKNGILDMKISTLQNAHWINQKSM